MVSVHESSFLVPSPKEHGEWAERYCNVEAPPALRVISKRIITYLPLSRLLRKGQSSNRSIHFTNTNKESLVRISQKHRNKQAGRCKAKFLDQHTDPAPQSSLHSPKNSHREDVISEDV